jgi:RNA polymerase sigma factor (sigma-70 family)
MLEVHVDDELEADLLDKARRGDRSAAPFLVSCYGERLLGYAHAHAPDLSDADRERIVELSIEAGVRAINRFDPAKGTLRSWFRGQIRYQTLAWRRARPAAGSLPDDLAPPLREPCADSAVAEALQRVIARLPHDDQVILALRSSERISYSEIAQRLDIKAAAARQRHKRALQRLSMEARGETVLAHLCVEEDE